MARYPLRDWGDNDARSEDRSADVSVSAAGAGRQPLERHGGWGKHAFQGVIIAESCRVEAGDQQMTVNMGQISSNRFHSAGEDANPVPFDIHLQDCSTAVSQHVGVSFRGVADGKNPDVLSVGEGPGIATGVGIALFDNEDQLIPLNSPPGAGGGCIPAPPRYIL